MNFVFIILGGQSATSKLDIINKAMLPPPPLVSEDAFHMTCNTPYLLVAI
jgi:hypothetical protein